MRDAKGELAERARLLAFALGDFDVFCRALVWISQKSGARSTLRFNPIQARFCKERTGRDCVVKSRQVGLSTVENARDVWRFLQRGQRVVIVCQSITGNAPLKKISGDIQRMFEGLRRGGLELDFGTDSASLWTLPDRDSSLQIIESGASEAAAQKKGRGSSFSRLHITECSFFEHPELSLNALLEGIPVGGDTEVTFESTPNGAGTWFHNLFLNAQAGSNGYKAHFYAWFDEPGYATPLHPGEFITPDDARERELVTKHGISPEQLKWYRQKVAEKGQDLVDQEYPSDAERCFLVSGRTFFDKNATAKLIAAATPPISTSPDGTLRTWVAPQPGKTYVISVDPSEGTGGDSGAAIVRERSTGQLCAVLHGQFPTWEMAGVVDTLGWRYNEAALVIERNNHGHAVLQALEHGDDANDRKPYRNVFRDTDDKYGWLNTAITRSTALEALEKAHRDGTWSTPDSRTVGEFRTFVVNKHGKAEAQGGSHDDLVLAEAIIHSVLSRPIAPIPKPPARQPITRFGSGRGF